MRRSSPRRYIKVLKPVRVAQGDAYGELRPYARGFRVEAEIEFEHPLIGRQSLALDVAPDTFRRELARARTFGFMRDVAKLWSAGYALGASFENTLVVTDNRVLNPDGLRFADEFVRHKMLDAIGDLALAGAPLLGAYRTVRGGHKLNHAVLSALMADPSAWIMVEGEAPRRSAAMPKWRPGGGPGLRAGRDFLTWLIGGFSATFPADCPPISLAGRGFIGSAGRSGCACGGRLNLARGRASSDPWHCRDRSRRSAPGASRAGALRCLLCARLALGSLQPVRRQGCAAPDEPADKLYNEGLYLLNNKRDYKDAAKKFEEVDRQHPYSEWARKSLIMIGLSPITRPANMTTPSAPPSATWRCIRAARTPPMRNILIGSSYLRSDPRHHPRSGAAPRRRSQTLERWFANIPIPNMRRRRSGRSRSRATSSPARRWMSAATTWNGATTPAPSTASRWW